MQIQPPAPPSATETPDVLHLGSGKNFQPAWLNVDIDPYWQPDIVADLGQPFPGQQRNFETARFGTITVAPVSFSAIVADDVLEHVPDLVTCMTNCLQLLRVGGVFKINVPYDLSLGAWSDPTHVRAFNERSWIYYTDWCWYMGWQDFHFRLQKLEFTASDYGRQLLGAGKDQAAVVRIPRAVDGMYVELIKQPIPAQLREICQRYPQGNRSS